MRKNTLLILDDDPRLRSALKDDFHDKGYEVTAIATTKDLLDRPVFDYAILDMRLVGEIGLTVIPRLLEANSQCQIVVLTGYGSVASAVEAIKLGAINYLHKPTTSDLIEAALKNELKKAEVVEAASVASLNQHEHEYIEFVLMQNHGNISKTAKQLGLHRQSLQRKLKKFPT